MFKILSTSSLVLLAAFAFAACSSAPATNSNANTAVVVNSNPTLNNVNVAAGNDPTTTVQMSPAANSAVPGIPNAPANMQLKNDPTRTAKAQPLTQPAPDNSEITQSLGQNLVKTRVFKNNAQLAKVEETTDLTANKKTIKVYLRNGLVKELPENAVKDAMGASAADLARAAEGAPDAKPEEKPAAQTGEQPMKMQKRPPGKQQQ